MFREPDALSIARLHDATLARKDWPEDASEPVMPGAWCWIHANHRYNTLLWNEENKARRSDARPADIANCKRLIDRYNQRRNDAIEAIDEALLAQLPDVEPLNNSRLSSETAGSMIDRLSILALKICHMREQTERADAGSHHVGACAGKLKRLIVQRNDLARCLDQLLRDARLGRAYFKVYQQFKLFDDPSPDPYIYPRQSDNAAGSDAA